MRKDLCTISNDEVQEYMFLMSNLYTWKTLLKIKEINKSAAMREDVAAEINLAQEKINVFKIDLLSKYDAPIYISEPLYVDTVKKTIYINL